MKVDKVFQIEILRRCVKTYPESAKPLEEELIRIAPGNGEEEKRKTLYANLAALGEFGYIERRFKGTSFTDFRITAHGLLAAGENILPPVPNAQTADAIYELIKALKSSKS